MNRRSSRQQAGFTIIELSLAMAFIAMLLLGIAFLTIQISTIYNKGLTIRAVNEAGQLISRDMQQTLNSSKATNVLYVENATTGGRLCANNVVYAWNYAGRLTNGFNQFDTPGREVRMVRFTGDNSFCIPDGGGAYRVISTANDTISELLKAGDNTLAIHSMSALREEASPLPVKPVGEPVKDDDTQRLYEFGFVLGTSDTAIIASNGCEAPENRTEDQYCSVNRFTVTARAGNKGVSDVFN